MTASITQLERVLTGTWQLSLTSETDNRTGEGQYTFKLAGTFNAAVNDAFAGPVTWHGYWEVRDGLLVLQASVMDAFCSSCLGHAQGHVWHITPAHIEAGVIIGKIHRTEDDSHVLGQFTRLRS